MDQPTVITDLFKDIARLCRTIRSSWKCVLFHSEDDKLVICRAGWDRHHRRCSVCSREWIG